ncbi:MAG: GDSL-type esterase/lipase family protein [Clostridia bacterium]|nr:GDSL-type esterase/lipase family protein [Clostridia bacterium]
MEEKKWTAGWGCASTTTAQAVSDYVEDITFRYVIYPTMNATAVRLHFSNLCGHETIKVDKVFVARRSAWKAAVPGTAVEVTVGGKSGFTLAAGEESVSDPAEFTVEPGAEFFVSMYIKDKTELCSGHWNSHSMITKYYSRGDYAAADDIPTLTYGENCPYVFLNTIDFLTDPDCAAIIAFGDSITAQPWPDCFARRLVEMGVTNRSIVRKGIGGGRVLREYQCRIKKHWGVAGIKRFEHDVVQAGADRVFVLHGINDIIHPGLNNPLCPMSELPTVEELVGGYRKYIEIARKHGMKIYFSTLLPCPRCLNDGGEREKIRCGANEWIRTSGEHDGVIDYETAVMNQEDPKQMDPQYDSGDHLHPSVAGAKHMAYSIPEEYFKN